LKIEESRLSVLFAGIADAVGENRLGAAARLADSARRFAPHDPTASLLHGRLLLQTGAAAAAVESLRGRDERDCVILRAEAAREAGWLEESRSSCQSLLSRYAVDGVNGLATAVRRLCQRAPDLFPGWVGVDSRLRLVGEVVAGGIITVEREADRVAVLDVPRPNRGRLNPTPAGQPLAAFSTELTSHRPGRLRVRTGGVDLVGSGLCWPPDFGFSGWVVLEGGGLSGEVCLDWVPESPVRLTISGARFETRFQVDPVSRGVVGWPFVVPHAALGPDSARADLQICAILPSGATAALAGSPIRSHQARPRRLARPKSRRPAEARALPPSVNIVVPVYSGPRETLDCLQSVLATMPGNASTLTIVDDASPDPVLRNGLDRLALDPRVTVLRNPANLGFPGAANRGIRLHREHDVVLLNADTEVFDGWLERLQAAAYSSDDIGTVTPLGEAASIASYPKSRSRNGYTTAEAEEIDRIARAVNGHEIIDVPVGVGFCLYIRRRCLDEIGDFDEHSFGKGYGEENDLCLRAGHQGWRHVVATGVFVRHVGGRSFGPAKAVLTTRNSRVINYRYPGYDRLVADFIASDPLRRTRRAIDRQRLIERASKPVLLVTLDLPGGVKRYVDLRQSALQSAQHTVLTLRAASEGGKRMAVIRVAESDIDHLAYDLEVAREVEELRSLLHALHLVWIEVHHFLGLPASILDMVARIGVPYRVFIHDYAWICPRVSLLNGGGVYCGEPALEACEACVSQHGAAFEEPTSVAELRKLSARILGGAEQVIAPTQDVRNRLRRYFPEVQLDVTPWEQGLRWREPAQTVKASPQGRARVAMIGAIGTPKGYSILLACARDAAARNLPLEFVVIGYTRDDETVLRTGRVFITGPYEEDEVTTLLAREQCHVALFPSMTPETWCYTLTHALESGLPIVAFDLGAVSERLQDARTGVLLPLDTSPASVNDVLLENARHSLSDHSTPPNKPTKKGNTVMQSNPDAATKSSGIPATVQLITLPVGIYAFTVRSGGSSSSRGLAVPALQVTPAPVPSNGHVEFLNGPTTLDRWLTRSSDVVTVKISRDSAALLLTSLSAPEGQALAIDVRRLDVPDVSGGEGERKPEATRIQAAILVHIQNAGDVEFTGGWAGRIEENFWIEGFAPTMHDPKLPDLLEYRAVMYGGTDTPWLSGGVLCGTRGAGIPLVAFAVRIREDAPAGLTCSYRGRFLSGTVVGPFADGRLCRSNSPDDPLVGIELQVSRLGADRGVYEAHPRTVAA
jgi:GT2 family glycosyltransferase